jgi:hypothetical protein
MFGFSLLRHFLALDKAIQTNLFISPFKMLKIIFTFIYVPFTIEILLRLMAPVAMMPRYVMASPFGVRCNMPNMSYRHRTPEYKISIRTNSKGIREDREIPYEKPKNTKRIILLGDSFGMGYGVELDQMFITRSKHYLKEKYGHEVEVVNLSTSGHGNAEELLTLQNEGFKYQPNLVILAWHNTDLSDNVRSNLFHIQNNKLEKNQKFYLPAVKEREILSQSPAYRFLAENSQIYNLLRNWFANKVKKWLINIRLKKFQNKINLNRDKKKTKREIENELTIAILKKIEKECIQKNIPFVILDIPLKKSRTEFESMFPTINNSEPFYVVSPIEKFKEKKGKQIYWEKGDGHFTPLGCDLVGEVLADYIQQENLLSK